MARKASITERAQQRLAQSTEYASAEVEAAADRRVHRPDATYVEVPIESVVANARNVRSDLGDLSELIASVTEVGVIEPLVVRAVGTDDRAHGYPEGTRYVVVMGGRRLEASRQARRATLPVMVRQDISRENERQLMLIENLQREDISPIDEAKAFKELIDAGLSQHALAKQIGKTQPHVHRRLQLLKLDDGIQQMIGEDRLGVDVAVTHLAKLAPEEQGEIAELIAQGDSRHDKPQSWDAEMVRDATAEVERARRRAKSAEDNTVEAEKAGAKVATLEELKGLLGKQFFDHRVYAKDEIKQAAEAGELYAVTATLDGPNYYTTAKKAAPEKSAPADDREAKERRERREQHVAVARWVETAKRPAKGPLLEMTARHIVDVMSKDDGSLVHKWLRGKAGADTDDYHEWKASLAEADLPTVAWLVTVAHDLLSSRWSPKSDAGTRTLKRIEDAT